MCEEYISSDVKLQDGQSVICPMCEKKFSFFYNSPSEKEEEQWPIIISSGEEFEQYLCGLINELPFAHCVKTKASWDQGVDLIVKINDVKIAIQCKFYSSPVGNDAIQQVIAGKLYYKCDEAMVVSNAAFISSAQDLANETKVILVNYKKLKTVLSNMYGNSLQDNQALQDAVATKDLRTAESVIIKDFSEKQSLSAAFTAVDALVSLYSRDNTFVFTKDSFALFARYYLNLANYCLKVMTECDGLNLERERIGYLFTLGFSNFEYFQRIALSFFKIAELYDDANQIENLLCNYKIKFNSFGSSIHDLPFGKPELSQRIPNLNKGINQVMEDTAFSFMLIAEEMFRLILLDTEEFLGVDIRQSKWNNQCAYFE